MSRLALRLTSRNLEAQLAAHVGLQLLGDLLGRVARLVVLGSTREVDDLADGHEAADAAIDDEAALVVVDDGSLDDLASIVLLLHGTPLALQASTTQGEHGMAVRGFRLQDVDEDGVADREFRLRLGIAPVEFAIADDALRLGADIDEHLVLVDAHDDALDHVAMLEAGDVARLLGEQLLHGGGLRTITHPLPPRPPRRFVSGGACSATSSVITEVSSAATLSASSTCSPTSRAGASAAGEASPGRAASTGSASLTRPASASDSAGASASSDAGGASASPATGAPAGAVTSAVAVSVSVSGPAVSSGLLAALTASVVCGSSTVNELVSLVDRLPPPEITKARARARASSASVRRPCPAGREDSSVTGPAWPAYSHSAGLANAITRRGTQQWRDAGAT